MHVFMYKCIHTLAHTTLSLSHTHTHTYTHSYSHIHIHTTLNLIGIQD